MAQEEECINIESKPRRQAGPASAEVGGAAELWCAAGAEALGTALLVLLSCLPAALGAPPLQAALAAGAVVAMLVQCFDHISFAMLNPVVTLAALLAARVCWRRAALYALAQVAGATTGALLLAALVPHQPASAPALTDESWCACVACLTLPASDVGAWRAAALEALLAAALALANLAHWHAHTASQGDSWPLRIAATVTALTLTAGGATGASANPARSLGPALCSGRWEHHWVYWVGPLSGGALATLLYRTAWHTAPRTPAGDVTMR